MGNASGVSRGDRNRNARLARLRALVPLENAIVGLDLADNKQVVVVCDHDWQVRQGGRFAAGPGIWVWRWTGHNAPRRGAGLGSRWRASRLGTGGG
jgi:hypothetical protein